MLTSMTHRCQRIRRVVAAISVTIAGVLVTPAVADFEYDYIPPLPGTYELPAIKAAGDGAVLMGDGEKAQLHDILAGKVTVLSFIYTRCSDPYACPFASGVLYDIHRVTKSDSVINANLQLVTFSFDPEHDTPSVMTDYGSALRSDTEGCPWRFLTTSGTKDLEPILDAYGQRVDRKKDPDDPMGPLYHLVRVYLIDRKKMIRNIYSFGLLDPRLLLTDVRTLLMEETDRVSAE